MEKPEPNDLIMQLASGFWAPRCLHVVAELGIADHLDDASCSTDDLAKTSGVDRDALGRVLRLLAMHGVFTANGDRFEHNDASRLLRTDNPRSMRSFVRMIGSDFEWSAFSTLQESVRTGEPGMNRVFAGGLFPYLKAHPEAGRIFDEAMTAKSRGDIAGILPSYDFSAFGVVVDVGGGRGHLLKAVIDANSSLRGVLFDLPQVAAHAVTASDERITFQGGDFFKDALPQGDAYFLSSVIHDWADAEAVSIISNVRSAIPETGKLLLFEYVVSEGPEFQRTKALDINMLVLTGGRERTLKEYTRLLESADFRVTRVVPTKGPMSIIEAAPQIGFQALQD